MTTKAGQRYAERFEQVFDYIDRHLDEALSVDELSNLANFSRFHFQRQFSGYVGLSVTRYIQHLRLQRAANQLVFNEQRRIIDIALEAGFENPESFSRAFKKSFGQTPSLFRKQPAWRPWNERLQRPERPRNTTMKVTIVDFAATLVGALEHCGDPGRVNESVKTFIDWRKASGLSPIASKRSFGIAYSDPDTTPPEDFRFDICGEIDAPVPKNPQGVITKQIPAGRCATVLHRGSLERIADSIYPLYREWLPESGEELRDFPLFFQYLKLPPDTPEHELETAIYLPLK
ncbi:MAG: AraC family transcriptional regulator [Candidatus Thiothrix singaporensis]|uniref:AraC family transcriptional regulator n=1 Tax=Candidatus Thiothrix singaporensis TaxID=2799669 RepID=A0A7L6AU31_9GAMM|nr:MAG: AraC family transcriptional regulator [Candidatus Thiothrix singaporensis]